MKAEDKKRGWKDGPPLPGGGPQIHENDPPASPAHAPKPAASPKIDIDIPAIAPSQK